MNPNQALEHISLLLRDRGRADEPWTVFTGHTLMVGDLGRTELASDAEEGARILCRTAQVRTMTSNVPPAPPRAAELRALNAGAHAAVA